jgi:hypothetical protein
MNLPTDSSSPSRSVGSQGGDGILGRGVAVLETQVQWNRYCEVCDGDELFIADLRCDRGLIGVCISCGSERIAPFSRVNSEVA